MTDQSEEAIPRKPSRFEKREQFRMKQIVGKVVTAASFTMDDGYMIEFDHQFKVRSCGPHTIWFRRRVQ